MTEPISDGAETFLRLLAEEFWCEMANHEIRATGASFKYASADDARLAMLRQAYQRGHDDAALDVLHQVRHALAGEHEDVSIASQVEQMIAERTPNFERDVQRVAQVNASVKKG